MRHRLLRVALACSAALGLAAATAPAVHADPAAPAAARCPKGHLCLFEGPHQTGRILLDEDAHITKDGFQLRELDDIEPPIFPRSAVNPLPDDFGCIIRLNDQPHFGGDEQELVGFGKHELDGRRVASLTSDCG
ncbi:peptidase inhibitor family I36 protein [Kitasatospora sp. NPDC058190]|uniref:peptidase inhibitor family I36 protein n=1 Tax=Kitasatospora sp. NPDC058190 TaxID=3346371 RepID=UPI0036DC509F